MSLTTISIAVFLALGVLLLLRTRRFYLVRHGETLLNKEHVRQGPEGDLSPLGQQQAEQVGNYLKQFPIESIISSTYPRAKETSLIIKKYLRVPVTYSQLLVERKNPSEIIGKKTHDPEVIKVVDQMDLAYHEDDFRFSDEENFADLRKRGRKCLALLARQGAPHTVVVTHHVFLKMLISYMLYHEHLHAADFTKLTFFNVSDNAGITVCEFNPLHIFSKTRGWKVISYNEQPS